MGRDTVRKRYTAEFKRRVMAFVDDGHSLAEAAREFNVPATSVASWMTKGDPIAHTDLRQEVLQLCWDEHTSSGKISARFGGIISWALSNGLAVWDRVECQRTGRRVKLMLLTERGSELLTEWKEES